VKPLRIFFTTYLPDRTDSRTEDIPGDTGDISMTPFRFITILLVLTGALIFAAGCTSPFPGGNVTPAATPAGDQIAASYKVTLHQPDARSEYIHMDTDIYNIGEVVEFTVTNDGSGTLVCAGDPPSFSVKFQGINGAWATRMGTDTPDTAKKSSLKPGASTSIYRFVTDGWDPGRYRIEHDCGVVREFILKPNPALAATPTETIPPETANTTLTATGNATPGSPAGAPPNATVTLPFNTKGLPTTSLP
jgi:hypothetical protein